MTLFSDGACEGPARDEQDEGELSQRHGRRTLLAPASRVFGAAGGTPQPLEGAIGATPGLRGDELAEEGRPRNKSRSPPPPRFRGVRGSTDLDVDMDRSEIGKIIAEVVAKEMNFVDSDHIRKLKKLNNCWLN